MTEGEEKERHIFICCFCVCVLPWQLLLKGGVCGCGGGSQEWWDHDVSGFTETDTVQNFSVGC